MSYSTAVTINAPADLIWSTLTDVERWPESTASIPTVQRLDNGPFEVGSRARVSQPKLPTIIWTVTDLQPLREFTWESPAPGVNTIARHAIAPAGDNAWTVTLSIERTGIFGPLLDRITDSITRKYVNMEAAGLKRVCEAAAAQIPSAA